WLVVAFTDEAAEAQWKPVIRSAFQFLSDQGIGGERSRGWGRFEWPEIVEGELPGLLLKLPESEGGDRAHWLLSLFHPSPDEAIDWQRGSYHVTLRRGRVESASAGSGAAKEATRMVAEGSVLVGSTPRGIVRNVAPEGFAHPVYRSGFALSIEIPWKGGGA
ncbi:MAG: hypothetical protein ABI823_07425, partial [Bryobacteraceae bacterium]